MTDRDDFQLALNAGLDAPWDKLYQAFCTRAVKDYDQWPGKRKVYDGDTRTNFFIKNVYFVLFFLNHSIEELENRHRDYSVFHHRFLQSVDKAEQNRLILALCQTLGASARQLSGDRKALRRWLNFDAITERSVRVQNDEEAYLAFLIERLPVFVGKLWENEGSANKLGSWRRFKFEKLLMPLLTYRYGGRIKMSAFKSLGQLLTLLASEKISALPAEVVRYIYRYAIDNQQPVWTQVEALQLLGQLDPDQLKVICQLRLTDIELAPADDLFFRHYLVLEIAKHYRRQTELLVYLKPLRQDPKAYVRQACAQILAELPAVEAQQSFDQLIDDADTAVRGAAVIAIPDMIVGQQNVEPCLSQLLRVLDKDTDGFVTRCALSVIVDSYQNILQVDAEHAEDALSRIYDSLSLLHVSAVETSVRRWAAQSREQLWASLHPQSKVLQELLTVAPGRRHKLIGSERELLVNEESKRWLSSQTFDSFGFDIADKSLVRDSNEGFRFWRFLHELRTPATDKRENHNHLKGRIYFGLDQVPAQQLAEVSVTKVPGEPLHMEEEGGWRPYLPLVDQLISSLDQGWPTRPLKIYSSEGITEVMPPNSFVRRLLARIQLTLRFSYYSRLRNWSSEDPHGPDSYLASLKNIGFSFAINGYRDGRGGRFASDPHVSRFFSLSTLPAVWLSWSAQFQSYFFSVYQNTLSQLIVFLVGMSSLFIGLHVNANRLFKRHRKNIPLVIGGWGTRGKSGTERLKAGLFNALGFSVLSKTTGCEAMFLYAGKNSQLFEMFLFRPFDKATIWEQVNVTGIASKLKTDVFLWECMGLTPRYIDILQQQWMKDDMATITNCYPDHEDLQGPAGVEIPRVMTRFVPKNAVLLTSEENMLPFLKIAASEKNTRLINVGWRETGLITDDILARFPYQEHRSNIALVAALGREFGLNDAYSFKEMADRVVADLGALKTYPVARLNGRRLQFINGMSANEHYGALGNWKRVGLDEVDLDRDADTWITTVVNNREDRVARSKVFAEFLVRDVRVDQHFLIGNNLAGLTGFIEESWQRFIDEQELIAGISASQAKIKLLQLATHLRLLQSESHLKSRLGAMCEGQGSAPLGDADQIQDLNVAKLQRDATRRRYDSDCQQLHDLNRLLRELQAFADSAQAVDTAWVDAAKAQLWEWFSCKLIVVEQYYTSGNELNSLIADHCPPGLLSRIMGLQNIKGTGLDFVYRWKAWEKQYRLCESLYSDDEEVARSALLALAKVQDFGVIDGEFVTESLLEAKALRFSQTELCQAQLAACQSRLDRQLEKLRREGGANDEGWLLRLADIVETFLDAGDAVRRRRQANLIIQDLVNERVSQETAERELQLLTQAQKGGWLKKRWFPPT
jgi:poly-gamma-glutamate synthase PgsB/CapB